MCEQVGGRILPIVFLEWNVLFGKCLIEKSVSLSHFNKCMEIVDSLECDIGLKSKVSQQKGNIDRVYRKENK